MRSYHPLILSTLQALGELLRELGKDAEAADHIERALLLDSVQEEYGQEGERGTH